MPGEDSLRFAEFPPNENSASRLILSSSRLTAAQFVPNSNFAFVAFFNESVAMQLDRAAGTGSPDSMKPIVGWVERSDTHHLSRRETVDGYRAPEAGALHPSYALVTPSARTDI